MKLSFFKSKLGTVLAILYLLLIAFVLFDYARCRGSWINLCGLLLSLTISPSEATVGYFLQIIGIPKINYIEPHFFDIVQIALHILICTLIVYTLGCLAGKIFKSSFSHI